MGCKVSAFNIGLDSDFLQVLLNDHRCLLTDSITGRYREYQLMGAVPAFFCKKLFCLLRVIAYIDNLIVIQMALGEWSECRLSLAL